MADLGKIVEVDHVCHNRDLTCPGGDGCPHRACVYIPHLEVVTGAENQRRMAEHLRGYRRSARLARA